MQNSRRPILWGILLAVLAVAVVLIYLFKNEIGNLLGFVPPPCGQSQLEINGQIYPIETIRPKQDGSIKVPNKPGAAYWVDGTTSNYVFYINDAVSTSGGAAKITWANCNATAYILYQPEPGLPDNVALLDQSTSEITIIVQNKMVIKGGLIGEELNVIPTPDPAEMLAEISLLETTTAADKTTISVQVSIVNYGQSAITLTLNDVALLAENAPTAFPGSEPALPKEIAPGVTENFTFTFARPNTPTATLKIFSAEYELEGY